MTPRRFRRLGMTSMALSVSASALVLGSALPAAAAENTAAVKPKKCVKGTDPKSTLENIVCQTQNTIDDIKQKIDDSKKPQDVPEKKPPVKEKAAKKTPKRSTMRYSAPVEVPISPPNSTVPLSRPESLKQVPDLPTVSDVLPNQPQVAPQSPTTIAAAPETHMVSPVASVTSTDDSTALWVAGASGLAAGIVMLQFSLIGARLRRRLPE